MIGCGEQYTDEFLRPLNTLAEQLAGTTGSARPLEAGFDQRINEMANNVESRLRASAQPAQLRRDEEEPAAAACLPSAQPSVINSSSRSGIVR
jgi:CHASE3 domain sensor protein